MPEQYKLSADWKKHIAATKRQEAADTAELKRRHKGDPRGLARALSERFPMPMPGMMLRPERRKELRALAGLPPDPDPVAPNPTPDMTPTADPGAITEVIKNAIADSLKSLPQLASVHPTTPAVVVEPPEKDKPDTNAKQADQLADGVYENRDIVCAGKRFKSVPKLERKIFGFMVGKSRDDLNALYRAAWDKKYTATADCRHKIHVRVSSLNQIIEPSGVSFSLPRDGDCIERKSDESVTPESRQNHQPP